MEKIYTISIFVVALVIPFVGVSQEKDSIQVQKEKAQQIQIDKLVKRLDSVETRLKNHKANAITHDEFENIFKSINGNDKEFIDEDRRSKRRALDSLFQLATADPGHLNFTGQLMSVFHWDGKSRNSINTGVATLDLFAISSFGERSLVFINLQSVGGNGPASTFNSFNGFHAGSGDTQSPNGFARLHIQEAWVEYQLKKTTFTMGKVDLTNYFDPNSVANDEYSQFLSNGFVNNAAFAVPGNNPGLVINTDLFKEFSLLFGFSTTDNDGDQLFEDIFSIVQISKSFKLKGKEMGGVRVHGYNNARIKEGLGLGVSADVRLVSNLYAFGRFGVNQDSLAASAGVLNAHSAGLQWRNFQLSKKLKITSGFAYSQSEGAKGEVDLKKEQAMEAYVSLIVQDILFISPHYQRVKNGAGLSDNDLSVIGFRARVAF